MTMLQLIMQHLDERGWTAALAALEREASEPYHRRLFPPHELARRLQLPPPLASSAALPQLTAGLDAASEPEDASLALQRAAGRSPVAEPPLRTLATRHMGNVTCVRWVPALEVPGRADGEGGVYSAMASAGADRFVCVGPAMGAHGDTPAAPPLMRVQLGAPVVTIDVHGERLLAGSMDGAVHLFDVSPCRRSEPPEALQSWRLHRKYAHAVRWAPDGSAFASASFDGVLRVYTRSESIQSESTQGGGSLASGGYEALQEELIFESAVESIEWVAGGSKLVAAVRGDHRLHLLSYPELARRTLNLNSNGDDFRSFSALLLER